MRWPKGGLLQHYGLWWENIVLEVKTTIVSYFRICVSTGPLFSHFNIQKVTFVTSHKWRTTLIDVRDRNGTEVISYLHLVVGQLRIKLSSNYQHHKTVSNRLDVVDFRRHLDTSSKSRKGCSFNMSYQTTLLPHSVLYDLLKAIWLELVGPATLTNFNTLNHIWMSNQISRSS